MNKLFKAAAIALFLCSSSMSFAYRYEYKTCNNDPTKALIYTLPNGLKVYMSVNKDKPRLQTMIAVRVGGKNDPAETTGLAHYFEHLMFKGTEQFGTQNYAAEKPMLDQIEQLFETYRMTSDSLQRAQIYHQIDSISYQASLIAIPNEYDKLMASIGADGTNAFTSEDCTCYVEEIPSNQIDNWAKIQADRFMHPVLRGFHTELETIYEEKNMSLTDDTDKAINALWAALYPHHPYGTQTVLGSQEHLKNPSITNVKNYKKQWYVPNNMAVLLAGDFDPDNAVDIITKYFSAMESNANLPKLKFEEEAPITSPVTREVKGLDAEFSFIAWRIPEAKNKDLMALKILGEVLQNGQCGLMDLNIDQQQRLLRSYAFVYPKADKGAFVEWGYPKEGQSFDEMHQILLEQVAKLRAGDFDDDLVQAAINNYYKSYQSQLEDNNSLVELFQDSFINGEDWSETIAAYNNLSALTKADIIAVANKYLRDDNYVIIKKVQGKDDTELKIAKPQITPIATNRDAQSQFVNDIQNSKVEPIEPHFVDYNTELTRAKAKKGQVEVLYTQNTTNELFRLTFVYEYGTWAVRPLVCANEYSYYLSTPDMTAEQIKKQFYKLGCSYGISPSAERTYISLNGLAKNMNEALKLLEHVLENMVPDKDVWNSTADRMIKNMNDAKLSQDACFSRLRSYVRYGGKDNDPQFSVSYTPEQLLQLNPKDITDAIKDLNNHKHSVIYYGPLSEKEFVKVLESNHHTAKKLADTPSYKRYVYATTTEPTIYVAPYDSKQLYMTMTANRGESFNVDKEPMRRFYNEYFDGAMNSIVFQEMRESRSLAYSASARMALSGRLASDPYYYSTFIATQNDKLIDATNTFDQIINELPQSQPAFEIAKSAIEARLRTQRTIKDDIAWSWISDKYYGLDHDIDADIFAQLPSVTLQDVVKYQQDNVKGNKYVYGILGNIEDLDLEGLKKFGRVVILTLEDIFGY